MKVYTIRSYDSEVHGAYLKLENAEAHVAEVNERLGKKAVVVVPVDIDDADEFYSPEPK